MALPSQHIGYASKGRIRPKSYRVWKCSVCKGEYDNQPYNRQTYSIACPQCGSDAVRETRVREREEPDMMNGLNSGVGSERPILKTPELIATLMKSGGKILIVGGSINDLPDNITNHPQIILWDDEKGSGRNDNKTVPTNVKVIMYNRWVSHQTAKRLSIAAAELRAIKFPMLRTREIKDLLSVFLQADAMDIPKEKLDETVANIVAVQETEKEPEQAINTEPVIHNEEPLNMVKQDRRKESPVKDFVIKHLNLNNDYRVKGSIAKEAARLYDLKTRPKTTLGSLNQAISRILIEIRKNKGESVEKKPRLKSEHGEPKVLSSHVPDKKVRANGDDFEQLESLIEDAIAAMKLVQEHLPKVRKETERLRNMREKVMKLFE